MKAPQDSEQGDTVVGFGKGSAGPGAPDPDDVPTRRHAPLPPGDLGSLDGDALPSTRGDAARSLATATIVSEEQSARGGAIVRLGLVVSLVAAVAIQLPGKQSEAGRWAATVALGAIFVSSFIALMVERVGRRMVPRVVFYLSLVVTPALVVVTAHVGLASPAVMAFVFGIYYFGMGDAKLEGWMCYGISGLGYAVVVVLTLTGALPTEGRLFDPGTDRIAIVAVAVVVEIMFGSVFWLARLSRRATVTAMNKLEQARRRIEQRDALLDEANRDLQVALGGKHGHLTGKVVAGYVVGKVLGRGGMGEVYACSDEGGERELAIKVLHAFMADDAVQVERFFREAAICSALDSPHIVKVVDHGSAADGSPYLVMERLSGHDLGYHLRRKRRFSIRDTMELVKQIAAALNAARDAGVVHRDLKPNNLFCDESVSPGTWKVLDFGVSKIRASSGTLTARDVVGTPGYMAPEQALGESVDHRADVFSLGAIVYRLLTGRPAFSGGDALAVMFQVTSRQPAQPSSLVRIPKDVDSVLVLALAKDRDRRLRSAALLASALDDAVRGELDPRFRADARALLMQHPWETRRPAASLEV